MTWNRLFVGVVLMMAGCFLRLLDAQEVSKSAQEARWIGLNPARQGVFEVTDASWQLLETPELEPGELKLPFHSAPTALLPKDDSGAIPLPMLRRLFELPEGKTLRSALLSVASPDPFAAYFCGRPVASPGRVVEPPQANELPLHTFDLTERFREEGCVGPYTVDILLGRSTNADALSLRALATLEITFEDGETQRILSDEQWVVTNGPVLYNDPAIGELIDAAFHFRALRYCDYAGAFGLPFTQYLLGNAAILDAPKGKRLGPVVSENVDKADDKTAPKEAEPVELTETSPGVWVADFGQTIYGRCRAVFHNEAPNDLITIRYLCDSAKGASAVSTDYLRCGTGDKPQFYEPFFTKRAFRRVEFSGLTHELKKEHIQAILLEE